MPLLLSLLMVFLAAKYHQQVKGGHQFNITVALRHATFSLEAPPTLDITLLPNKSNPTFPYLFFLP